MLGLYYLVRVVLSLNFLGLLIRLLSLLASLLRVLCKVLLVLPLCFLAYVLYFRFYRFFLRVFRALFAWTVFLFLGYELFGLRLRRAATGLVGLYQREVGFYFSRYAHLIGGISYFVQRRAVEGVSIQGYGYHGGHAVYSLGSVRSFMSLFRSSRSESYVLGN